MNTITKRAFSSIYNYSSAANPKVFLSVAAGGHKIGDLVFEIYQDKQPVAADNFQQLLKGTSDGRSYVGTQFTSGQNGLGIIGGKLDEANNGAYQCWNVDGDLNLRHYKRGLLTSVSEGPNQNGGQFMITFNEALFLDGYQTVFGELVEGHEVLDEIEKKVDRHGKVHDNLTIVAGGPK